MKRIDGHNGMASDSVDHRQPNAGELGQKLD